MVATILSNPVVVETLLPFLLVFTIIFAILQKTQILGKDKRQIDALVSLAIGLIVIAYGQATGIIVRLIPILAVTAVVILVFMLLYGMVFAEGKFDMNKYLKGGIGIAVGIVVIVSVLILTGGLNYIIDFYYRTEGTGLLANIVFIAIAAAAVIAVAAGGKKEKEEKKST